MRLHTSAIIGSKSLYINHCYATLQRPVRLACLWCVFDKNIVNVILPHLWNSSVFAPQRQNPRVCSFFFEFLTFST